MAFVASIAVTNRAQSSFFQTHSRPTSLHLHRTNRCSKWRMTASPEPTSSTNTSPTPSSDAASSNDNPEYAPIDTEVIMERAKGVVSDVKNRPGYYSKIAGYGVGALVLVTILRAIVSAIDSLPVLPPTLELIGLGYSAWFVWRYVLFRESRTELLEEIDDFLGRTRPGKGGQ